METVRFAFAIFSRVLGLPDFFHRPTRHWVADKPCPAIRAGATVPPVSTSLPSFHAQSLLG